MVQPPSATRTYIVQLDTSKLRLATEPAPTRSERKLAAASAMQAASTDAWQAAQAAIGGLASKGVTAQLLPFVGAVLVTAPRGVAAATVQALQGAEGVSGVWRDRSLHIDKPAPSVPTPPPTAAPEYHVTRVHAPEAWAAGATGANVVIGSIDTGADVDHEALKGAYRGHGPDGVTNHNYNWMDFVDPAAAPSDLREHGTHTIGIAAGQGGARNIGIAPQAKFIAARAIGPIGKTRQSDLLAGLNWMAAPTDSAGANADPTRAPDIINASWGLNPASDPYFRAAFQALVREGILPVVAAGNAGPGAGTLRMPASYPEAIAVAATDRDDKPGRFSSRGPGPFTDADGKPVPKPDIAAPGVDVVSSYARPGKHNLYIAMSGTSMAAPAAAGVAALVLSAFPQLTVAQLRDSLVSSTVDLGEPGHDTTFGSGRVDAVRALARAKQILGATPPGGSPPATAG